MIIRPRCPQLICISDTLRIFFLLLLFLPLAHPLCGQQPITGRLFSDNGPVPYANIWIADTNTGTTAAEDGQFTLSIDSLKPGMQLKISAIGYYDTLVAITATELRIKLVERVYALREVSVTPRKNKEYLIHDLRKTRMQGLILNDSTPKMLGLYFPHQPEYDEYRFIRKILVYTQDQQRFLFNLRVYRFDTLLQQPAEALISKNLLVRSEKSRSRKPKALEIDLAPYQLEFAETGLFVAIEWLIIPENRYTMEYHYQNNSRPKNTKIHYGPGVSATIDTEGNLWDYSQGRWKKRASMGELPKLKRQDNFFNPAISVVLSN